MKRSEVAAAAGCDPETVRFYEAKGLLSPAPRTQTGHRVYDGEALARLRFVCAARSVGFALDKVRTLLAALDGEANCGAVRAEAEALLRDLRERRAAIDGMEARLTGLLRACREPEGACGMVDLLAGAGGAAEAGRSRPREPPS